MSSVGTRGSRALNGLVLLVERSLRPNRGSKRSPGGQDDLFARRTGPGHWAFHYARLLVDRHPNGRRLVIESSMSPTGAFHVGNLRDTACAVLVQRALAELGRPSTILLGFDDYDPVRPAQARRHSGWRDVSGLPLADTGPLADRFCCDYISSLVALGWAPADLPSGASADGGWVVHRQAERYRSGTYTARQRHYHRIAPRLARILGVGRPEDLFAVYCECCGRNTTDIWRLEPDRVRYACRSCGSLWTTDDLGVVKPSWAVDWTLRVEHEGIDCEPAGADHTCAGSTMDRTRAVFTVLLGRDRPVIVPYGVVRGSAGPAKISGSAGGGLTPADLLTVLSGPMILWIYARVDSRSDIRIGLDRASMASWYDSYDRFMAAVPEDPSAAALARLVGADLTEQGLPRWRRLVGLLQSRCFDVDAVVRELGGREPTPELRARAMRARSWLAGPGRATTWLVAHADPCPVTPAQAAGLLDGDRLVRSWDRGRYTLLYRALFRTTSGPPLRTLCRLYGEEELVDALRQPDVAPLLVRAEAALDGGFGGR